MSKLSNNTNSNLAVNSEYKQWFTKIKETIQQSQIKAAIRVNVELLQLYWLLGAMIVEKQQSSVWGNGLIEQLSGDLRSEFPDLKGFSRTNLLYIRKWYLFYHDTSAIVPQAVGQLETSLAHKEIFQIPWGHNREIISKCQNLSDALYYVHQTIEHNWSRAVLVHQIESKLYAREGMALSNFAQTQSDLVQQSAF